MISFSIADLFAQIHGYNVDAFQFDQVTGYSGVTDLNRKEFGDYGTPYYKTGNTGSEYFMPVTVKYPDKSKIVTGLITGSMAILSEYDLPYPIVSISSQKTIVETPMTERKGSVKELVNINGYEISVKGLLINKKNEYPEDLVKALKSVFEVDTQMIMRCAATDIFLTDIGYNVVLRSMSLPEVKGIKNVIGYDLRFVSDLIFDLEEIV